MSLNVSIWKGTNSAIRIQVFQRDEVTPQNMSGWSLTFSVRNRAEDADLDLQKTTVSGIAITDGDPTTYPGEEVTGVGSVAVITLDDSDTDSLTPGIYECDLKRTDANLEAVLAFGRFNLKRGVTP